MSNAEDIVRVREAINLLELEIEDKQQLLAKYRADLQVLQAAEQEIAAPIPVRREPQTLDFNFDVMKRLAYNRLQQYQYNADELVEAVRDFLLAYGPASPYDILDRLTGISGSQERDLGKAIQQGLNLYVFRMDNNRLMLNSEYVASLSIRDFPMVRGQRLSELPNVVPLK